MKRLKKANVSAFSHSRSSVCCETTCRRSSLKSDASETWRTAEVAYGFNRAGLGRGKRSLSHHHHAVHSKPSPHRPGSHQRQDGQQMPPAKATKTVSMSVPMRSADSSFVSKCKDPIGNRCERSPAIGEAWPSGAGGSVSVEPTSRAALLSREAPEAAALDGGIGNEKPFTDFCACPDSAPGGMRTLNLPSVCPQSRPVCPEFALSLS